MSSENVPEDEETSIPDIDTSEPGYRDEDILRELYQERGMTTTEIAELFGCSDATVSRWINRHGLVNDREYRDADTLREMYHDRGMTTREIADELEYTHSTVIWWLDRHGIERRENCTDGVEAAKKSNRAEYVKMRTLNGERGYEYWETKVNEDGERVNKVMYVHRLLAISEYGFDALEDMDVIAHSVVAATTSPVYPVHLWSQYPESGR